MRSAAARAAAAAAGGAADSVWVYVRAVARPSANLRLFVAVYPPADLAREMLARMRAFDLDAHRATPPEQAHLTLHFIGDTPVREMERTEESVLRACAGLRAFELTPEAFIALPDASNPRLVALRTDAPPTLLEIKRRLALRFAKRSRRNAADRFVPHVTLCRFPTHASVAPFEDRPATGLRPFTVGRVLLMRSTIAAGGATHHLVAAAGLAP